MTVVYILGILALALVVLLPLLERINLRHPARQRNAYRRWLWPLMMILLLLQLLGLLLDT